ncbi:hypothetical protein ACPMJQ_34685 [Streptomyces pseudogriseolus]|uniref:hypothetical protein n=1 Tax=Streptomyces pseudogriseolus TaxID=36817 RepID=UPI003FA2AD82
MRKFEVLVVCMLVVQFAVMVGIGAGYLARRDGASYPAAALLACRVFGATLALTAAVTAAATGVMAVVTG